MVRFLLIAVFIAACAYGQEEQQQQEPSLAERAAAAVHRTATPTPTTTPQQTPAPGATAIASPNPGNPGSLATATANPLATSEGQTPAAAQETSCGFSDPLLGLEIACPADWTATTDTVAGGPEHLLLHLRSPDSQARNAKTFIVHDAAGATISLQIVRLLRGDRLPPNLRGELQRAYLAEHPASGISEEPGLLNDAEHHFAGFRAVYDDNGPHVESVQAMVFERRHFIQFVVSGNSQDLVSKILQQLKTQIAWK